jgi:hypothetical protein
LICQGTLQQECYGAIAVDRVLVVHNLGPKVFGGNGGDYCVHHILQGKFPYSIQHDLELISEFCLAMGP